MRAEIHAMKRIYKRKIYRKGQKNSGLSYRQLSKSEI